MIHGKVGELLVFILSHTVFNVFVAHLFFAGGFGAKDGELELINLLFNVLLETFFMENMITDS